MGGRAPLPTPGDWAIKLFCINSKGYQVDIKIIIKFGNMEI